MPRQKSTSKKKPSAKKATMSKTEFVRSLPEGTSAKDAVAKAKEAGIDLSDAYVYSIRSADRASAKKKAKVVPKAKGGAASNGGSLETTFRKLVLDLGLTRAKALLAEVERGLQAVIAGR